MIDGAGLSQLVLQAGFTIPTIDLDRHVLLYRTPCHLMEHLTAMGEDACHRMRAPLHRDTLLAACAVYDTRYRTNELIPATFEVFHTIAWSPSSTQRKPLARGSGQIPLAALNTSHQKRLQQLLNEYAQNGDDPKLHEEAEMLLQQLREESASLMEQRGIDADGFERNRDAEARSIASKPPPPFQ